MLHILWLSLAVQRMNVLVNLNNITVCLLMQAKAKVVQIHKPTFMTKEKCPKIGADYIPFLEVFSCEQPKTSSAMHYVATTLIIQEMVETLHATTAHTQ